MRKGVATMTPMTPTPTPTPIPMRIVDDAADTADDVAIATPDSDSWRLNELAPDAEPEADPAVADSASEPLPDPPPAGGALGRLIRTLQSAEVEYATAPPRRRDTIRAGLHETLDTWLLDRFSQAAASRRRSAAATDE